MFQLSKFSRRMAWPALGTGLVVLVVLCGYFILVHSRNGDPTSGLGAGMYQAPSNAGETLPVPILH